MEWYKKAKRPAKKTKDTGKLTNEKRVRERTLTMRVIQRERKR